jgi:hypothetical protein
MLLVAAFVGPASAASSLQLPSPAIKGLSAKWWQWAFSIPAGENPVSDDSGKNCGKGDMGRLFFLAGTTGGSASRDCTVSHKQAILVPILVNECSTLEGNGKTPNELKACNKAIIDQVSHVEVSVDGVDIPAARILSPPFKLKVIEDNVFNVPNSGTTLSVAEGYWVLLKPLSIGSHTIHFKGSIDAFNFEVEVTYHLTVT